MTTEGAPINHFLADSEPVRPEIAVALEAVTETLGGDCHVNFENSDKYLSGENRFLIGFTDGQEQRGFVKLCENAELKQQLQRETDAMVLAGKLGIPTIRVIHPYQESNQGVGIIQLEALDSKKGNNLGSAELIAGADPRLGKKAGEILSGIVAREIPNDGSDTGFLKRTDERNASVDSFWAHWKKIEAIVTSGEYGEIDPDLRSTFEVVARELGPLLEGPASNKEYFVHNDVSPENMFFDEVGNRVILLDFEHAGATTNPRLAAITDLGNFYARCWPNPEMQREFVKSLLDNLDEDAGQDALVLVKGLMVFNTLNLARFAMNPAHREHKMTQALLANLRENLSSAEQYYKESKTQE